MDESPIINELDRRKRVAKNGSEYWMARDLQLLLGYAHWQNFQQVIERARMACESAGGNPAHHFIETNEVMTGGKGAQIQRGDWFLSRYACYLVAMNGESSKPEIGLAQTYFAVQTRRQEVQDQLTDGARRVMLRDRVRDANKNLVGAAKIAGVQNYAFFHDAGYRGLYGGLRQADVKRRKQIPDNEKLLDRSGRVELAANEFRITQTEEKIRRERVRGQRDCERTHLGVGKKVRETIQAIGGTMPEDLPPEPHIKKLVSSMKRLAGRKPRALTQPETPPIPDTQD
jgi:DNA-damage-inducible protein D